MPIIKVCDIAFVRLHSPDLDAAERFLSAFGLLVNERSNTRLDMRATGPLPYVHVTELGAPKVAALGFTAAHAEDLETLSAVEGASSIEALEGPAGGERVRLRDPHGLQIEVVHGLTPVEAVPVVASVMNSGTHPLRKGELCRPAAGPARVKRLGHAVLQSPDVGTTVGWYRDTLGLIASDDVYAGSPENIIGSFNRCDRGESYVDHHTLFVVAGPRFGVNHIAFEVEGIDDIMLGNAHLAAQGYRHVWGIGRHFLGSQIFDYWNDPWGRIHEHWIDGDLLDASTPASTLPAEIGLASQWGDVVPAEFLATASEIFLPQSLQNV